jgi:hypothetical protein
MTLIRILNGSKQVTNFPDGLAVWCDRRSALGNPFELSSEESRDDVCDAYQVYFDAIVLYGNSPFAAADSLFENRPWLKKASGWRVSSRNEFMAALETLESLARDVNRSCRTRSLGLGCWCNPKRCHCLTILRYLLGKLWANEENTVTQGSLF